LVCPPVHLNEQKGGDNDERKRVNHDGAMDRMVWGQG
jgi:hypothetical protein